VNDKTEAEDVCKAVRTIQDANRGSGDAKAKFYCETCSKQYHTAMEWEMHLSSYDHHHKKRWREMNQMVSGRTKKKRMKKEQKQMTRDMDAFAEQFERARKEEQTLEASKPKSDPKNITTVKHDSSSGIVFNLKIEKKPMTCRGKHPSVTPSKTCDAFGADSDSD